MLRASHFIQLRPRPQKYSVCVGGMLELVGWLCNSKMWGVWGAALVTRPTPGCPSIKRSAAQWSRFPRNPYYYTTIIKLYCHYTTILLLYDYYTTTWLWYHTTQLCNSEKRVLETEVSEKTINKMYPVTVQTSMATEYAKSSIQFDTSWKNVRQRAWETTSDTPLSKPSTTWDNGISWSVILLTVIWEEELLGSQGKQYQ